MSETKSLEQRTLETIIATAEAATVTAADAARLASTVALTLASTTAAVVQAQADIIALLQHLVQNTNKGKP